VGGYFGQLSFQTSNFMGRGETFSILMQAGSRAQNYQIAFTEPFLFDRNITVASTSSSGATTSTARSRSRPRAAT